uniref:BTB domain-containing protein n=1 Tax=Arcella intermedia TaxID=1963864 RepID=A0A6B2LDY6_9EUKA
MNVGGTCFTTSLSTLRKFPNSHLGKMFTIGEGVVRDSYGRFFIDRDPVLFAIFLNYLRTGNVSIPPGISATQLLEESLYYNFEAFDLPVAMNVAEQFRNINLKAVRSSFDKLWPILQKRMKLILENEPVYAAEIEWGPKQSTHNSLYKVEVNYTGDWIVTKCFIKVEISWKEEETIRPCSCVETWAKYLSDFGFRTQVVSTYQLRFFW